jgi:hypothetical protein
MHTMHAAGFEDLMAALKQKIEMLEEKNRTLEAHLAQARQELNELRHGVGITVYVAGKPVATGSGPAMPDVLPTSGAPTPGMRPLAAPAVLHDPHPPDVAPLPSPPQSYARQNAAPNNRADGAGRASSRNVNYADYFVDDPLVR